MLKGLSGRQVHYLSFRNVDPNRLVDPSLLLVYLRSFVFYRPGFYGRIWRVHETNWWLEVSVSLKTSPGPVKSSSTFVFLDPFIISSRYRCDTKVRPRLLVVRSLLCCCLGSQRRYIVGLHTGYDFLFFDFFTWGSLGSTTRDICFWSFIDNSLQISKIPFTLELLRITHSLLVVLLYFWYFY